MELTIYENAKHAVAQYKTVDEVKDFRDKAAAVQAYAKQANNYELERDAAIARVRAERKCGELLKEMNLQESTKRNLKQNTPECPEGNPVKTLDEMGVTGKQSSQWQKLANVPEDVFEEVISSGMPISGAQVLATADPQTEVTKKIDTTALWIWGTLRDMEREILKRPLAELVSEMTDGMRPDADRIIPKLTQWLKDYDNT